MSAAHEQERPDAPPQAGRFAGVSPFRFLLATGVVVALGLAATRDLFQDHPTAHASSEYRTLADTGFEAVLAARDALVAGDVLELDDAVVSVEEAGGGVSVLRADALRDDVVVSTVRAVGSFTPAPRAAPAGPDDLPRLSAAAVEQLLRDPRLDVRRVRRDTEVVGEVLSGLVVLSPGVELRLRDVVLVGAIVSESALTQQPLTGVSVDHAPTVVVEGPLRLQPMGELPGVSVVMPDGVLRTADDDAAVQIEGDVVARTVELRGRGSLLGRVASLEAPVLSGVRAVGRGRTPRPWSTALDMRGGLRTDYFTCLPARTRWQEVRPMLGFEFP